MNDQNYCSISAQIPGLTGQSYFHRSVLTQNLVKEIPNAITFELSEGLEIGGTVLDEGGKPLSGINIAIQAADTIGSENQTRKIRNRLNHLAEDGI